jgi:hypothetical protein
MQMLINCSKNLHPNLRKGTTNNNGHFHEWVIYSLLKKHTLEILHMHLHFENNTHKYEKQNSFSPLEIKAFTNQAKISGVLPYIET